MALTWQAAGVSSLSRRRNIELSITLMAAPARGERRRRARIGGRTARKDNNNVAHRKPLLFDSDHRLGGSSLEEASRLASSSKVENPGCHLQA